VLDWPIALLVLMVLVSLWATFDIGFSGRKVIGLLLGVAAYYATVACVRDERSFVRALGFYVGLGTIVAILSIVGTRWLLKNPSLSSIVVRLPKLIRGLPGASRGFHPNEVAGVLLWVVPVQWVWLGWQLRRRQGKTRDTALLLLSTLFTTGTLLLTQSRGAFLGLAIWLAIWGACSDHRLRIGVGALTLAGGAFFLWKGPVWMSSTLRHGFAMQLWGKLHWDFRLRVWREALRGIQDFPLTGMGMGAFRHTVRVFYPLSIATNYDIAHAHNAFLQTALDLGLPGLAAYTAIWLATAHAVMKCLRSAAGWSRAVALGFGGCLISYFVYGMLDAVALGAIPGVMWWMMLGLIVRLEWLGQPRYDGRSLQPGEDA